ncbi:hypothetical protein ACFFLZ_14830 [Photobacterium aphoticum]|uniref:Uncharacterized protein n=1 Tax=Photobacterium aphoticum TaxID=754436 RepID=A0A0J1GLD0_9GAMM|nr:hypothetical protein [Photobacterium aphoticum]KLV00239.1 hypothetical protein ABT58_14765 [Photobacterium aphoticum]PSU56607.1 hypothetical protein C9I90_12470 [Photobacterium aphoticum]GHA55826.1 hypothetical protein GCM10007086_32290 [Photobacterium aphoticum]
MYNNIDKVLENIHEHFQTLFGEKFEEKRQFRYVDYISENYNFRVHAAFIQTRIADDFDVSIQQRIDHALKGLNVEKGAMYDFTTKFVDDALSTEYCVELIK